MKHVGLTLAQTLLSPLSCSEWSLQCVWCTFLFTALSALVIDSCSLCWAVHYMASQAPHPITGCSSLTGWGGWPRGGEVGVLECTVISLSYGTEWSENTQCTWIHPRHTLVKLLTYYIGNATSLMKASGFVKFNCYSQDPLFACQINQLADLLFYESNVAATVSDPLDLSAL